MSTAGKLNKVYFPREKSKKMQQPVYGTDAQSEKSARANTALRPSTKGIPGGYTTRKKQYYDVGAS